MFKDRINRSLQRVPFAVAALSLFGLQATWQGLAVQPQPSGAEESAKGLIVMIDATLGDSPTFGAGIIFGYTDHRLYIATADHVVREGLKEVEGIRIQFKSLPGEIVEAKLLTHRDRDLDLAVLAVDLEEYSVPVGLISFDRLGDASGLKRGEGVFHVGYPNGIPWWVNFDPDRVSEPPAIRVRFASAQVVSGDSGGGLFNDRWELVGMVIKDRPPVAEATAVGPILAQLKRWGYPVALKPAGDTSIASGTARGGADSNKEVSLSADLAGGVEIEFVQIGPGEFIMGSTTGDEDEKPVRRVRISKGFQLGKYEVTQERWRAVMGDNPSKFKGDKRPVETVSWEDAQQFVAKMNQRNDGFLYRLPTEAEWEYAARAGTTGDYAGVLEEMAWYASNSGNKIIDADAIWRTNTDIFHYVTRVEGNGGQTHIVGTKVPNEWGLYDMHGNVWEWVQDWYQDDYYGTRPNLDTDPQSPPSGSRRVVRGGSWLYPASHCRSAGRVSSSGGDDDLGFRLLRFSR